MPTFADTETLTFEEYAAAAWPSLYRRAYLLARSHADAEDLAQQTLIKTHSAWSRVSRSDVPDAYVRRILMNTFLSFKRPKGRRLELLVGDDAPESARRGGRPCHGRHARHPQTREPARAPAPSLTRGPASAEPKLISYDGDGSGPAEVRTRADANNLAGAPDSFKKFIGRTAERLTKGTTCEQGYVGVTGKSLRTDGYAVGAVNECGGGYVAMWAIVNGDWKEIDATQDLPDCAVLAKYRVPSDIAGDTCYDDDAQAQHSYQQP